MANDAQPGPGQIGWIDLTVPGAEAVRDFYQEVTGWTATPVAMGGYRDYCMVAASGQSVAGICHAQGVNAGQPPVWMIYIVVADLDEAMLRCQARGGKVLRTPAGAGAGNRFCVIQDPAGAVAGLLESRSESV
jgi:predicted enzyme related to lactoylglutathione lyase